MRYYIAGDLTQDGSEESFNVFDSMVYKPLVELFGLTGKPVYVVPGNHDHQRDLNYAADVFGLYNKLSEYKNSRDLIVNDDVKNRGIREYFNRLRKKLKRLLYLNKHGLDQSKEIKQILSRLRHPMFILDNQIKQREIISDSKSWNLCIGNRFKNYNDYVRQLCKDIIVDERMGGPWVSRFNIEDKVYPFEVIGVNSAIASNGMGEGKDSWLWTHTNQFMSLIEGVKREYLR